MTVGAPGLYLNPVEKDPLRQNSVIRQLIERTYAVGTITLSSTGATSTSFTSLTSRVDSSIFLFPQTSYAATNDWDVYVDSVVAGGFTVHHSSSTSTSRTFSWAALG